MTDTPQSLRWRKVSDWCIAASHNGVRYTVTKVSVRDEHRFFAWGPPPGPPPKRGRYDWQDYIHRPLAGPFADSQEAKDACARHAGIGEPADER